MSNKLIVLTSGGLDSFIAYYYADQLGYSNRTALWVDLGHPYADKERECVRSFPYPVEEIECKTISTRYGNIPTIKQQIIPGRNLLLATIAASIGGDRIWISALDGEMHQHMPDKNKTFMLSASGLFTYVFHQFTDGVMVETPFSTMTKAELVRWALHDGMTAKQFALTTTCYDPSDRLPCGLCSACFKRWIAMTLNGIDEQHHHLPWKSLYAAEVTDEMVTSVANHNYTHYSTKRIYETFTALDQVTRLSREQHEALMLVREVYHRGSSSS